MVLAVTPPYRSGASATKPASASRSQTPRKTSVSPHHACKTSTPGPDPLAGTAIYSPLVRSLVMACFLLFAMLPQSAFGTAWACRGNVTDRPLRMRLWAARVSLSPRDGIYLIARDAVLAEKEAQVRRMLLHVAHGIEQQLQIADGLPFTPWILDGPACLLVRQRGQRRLALPARVREIGAQLLLGIWPVGCRLDRIEHSLGKGSRGSKVLLRGAGEIQVEPDKRVIADIPERSEPRWEPRWRGVGPELLLPEGVGADQQGVVEHINGRAELRPQRGAPHGVHVPSSRFTRSRDTSWSTSLSGILSIHGIQAKMRPDCREIGRMFVDSHIRGGPRCTTRLRAC